ncbi:Hypothetical predicted protein, partial [Paramuricea clavata]
KSQTQWNREIEFALATCQVDLEETHFVRGRPNDNFHVIQEGVTWIIKHRSIVSTFNVYTSSLEAKVSSFLNVPAFLHHVRHPYKNACHFTKCLNALISEKLGVYIFRFGVTPGILRKVDKASDVSTDCKSIRSSCDGEVNRICAFNGTVVFTDTKAGQVKQYHQVDSSASVFLGSGETKSRDGTQSSCSFEQVQGICNMENTLFVTDVSAGKVKLVTGLSSTITFLQMLGSFYDAFEIHPKCVPGGNVNEVSLQSAREKVKEVERYMRDTVTKVKQRYNLKESSTTNGPEGTISHQTQTSSALLNEGICRLSKNIEGINSHFVDNISLQSLLTTQVENLHADFGTIDKAEQVDESVKQKILALLSNCQIPSFRIELTNKQAGRGRGRRGKGEKLRTSALTLTPGKRRDIVSCDVSILVCTLFRKAEREYMNETTIDYRGQAVALFRAFIFP